jgi:hypothetical protein
VVVIIGRIALAKIMLIGYWYIVFVTVAFITLVRRVVHNVCARARDRNSVIALRTVERRRRRRTLLQR